MYKFVFFVPETHLVAVKQAAFSAGAGKLGDYDSCCWQTLGMGQFRPLKNSQPFIGNLNTLTEVKEYRVEMLCPDEYIKAVIQAVRAAHPYEEPALEAWRLDVW